MPSIHVTGDIDVDQLDPSWVDLNETSGLTPEGREALLGLPIGDLAAIGTGVFENAPPGPPDGIPIEQLVQPPTEEQPREPAPESD